MALCKRLEDSVDHLCFHFKQHGEFGHRSLNNSLHIFKIPFDLKKNKNSPSLYELLLSSICLESVGQLAGHLVRSRCNRKLYLLLLLISKAKPNLLLYRKRKESLNFPFTVREFMRLYYRSPEPDHSSLNLYEGSYQPLC